MAAPGDKKTPIALALPEHEADLRYAAALAVPFPVDVPRQHVQHVWAFCVSRGQALSSHPGGSIVKQTIQSFGPT